MDLVIHECEGIIGLSSDNWRFEIRGKKFPDHPKRQWKIRIIALGENESTQYYNDINYCPCCGEKLE